MGGDRVNVKNVEIIEVDEINNFIYLKGAVAGARNGLVLIEGKGDLVVDKVEAPKTEAVEVKVEEVKTEEAKVEEVKEEAK
jgi:hypothetical protein